MSEKNVIEQQLVDLNKLGQQFDQQFKEWKAFAFQNRTLDTVIAFTLGVAFSKLVTGLSEGLIMPCVQFLGAYTGASWRDMVWEPIPNLIFEVGALYAATADFLLTSIVLFAIWKLWKKFTREPHENQESQEKHH